MIGFAFTFPAGRYHATPWGRHANEADVAWPPEPVRILRALIATWHRKADQDRFSKAQLDDLVDTLAMEAPVYKLPPAVHSHIRAYMPAPVHKTLIFDGFLRLDKAATVVVAWPDVALSDEQKDLAAHLLARVGYIGRAESWAEGRLATDEEVTATLEAPQAAPVGTQAASEADTPVDIYLPITAQVWSDIRAQHLEDAAKLAKKKRETLEVTLPERLADALAVDTSAWQAAGWSSPPPMRRLVYIRPEVGPLPKRIAPRSSKTRTHEQTPLVARYVLAGRPPPRIEDSLEIGEVLRRALMSRCDRDKVPPELSGRNGREPLRDDPRHAHAFFLPEDADDDGLIDHLIVYSRTGFPDEMRKALDSLTRLYVDKKGAAAQPDDTEDGEVPPGRKEWRLALEGIAAPEAFAKTSPLLTPSRRWVTVTPYLMPWHAKPGCGYKEQIAREFGERGIGILAAEPQIYESLCFAKRPNRRPVEFRRFRRRRGLVQPDRLGRFVTLEFEEKIKGPLALGFGCHFGLGIFCDQTVVLNGFS